MLLNLGYEMSSEIQGGKSVVKLPSIVTFLNKEQLRHVAVAFCAYL
jgi:hypothetical protein